MAFRLFITYSMTLYEMSIIYRGMRYYRIKMEPCWTN